MSKEKMSNKCPNCGNPDDFMKETGSCLCGECYQKQICWTRPGIVFYDDISKENTDVDIDWDNIKANVSCSSNMSGVCTSCGRDIKFKPQYHLDEENVLCSDCYNPKEKAAKKMTLSTPFQKNNTSPEGDTKHLNKSEKNREHLERSKKEYMFVNWEETMGTSDELNNMHVSCRCGYFETWLSVPGEMHCPICGCIISVSYDKSGLRITETISNVKKARAFVTEQFEDSPHVNGLWVVAVAMAVFVLLVGIAYLTR